MQAEIITIGDELLIGQVVDTNSAWIAQQLNAIGIALYQITSVHDQADHITQAIDQALHRSELVLVTGGLGPTKDDITKQVLCNYFHTTLVHDEAVKQQVYAMYAHRPDVLNRLTATQWLVPANAQILPNRVGTAPLMHWSVNGHDLYCMPGVPYEMEIAMREQILPRLSSDRLITHRTLMVRGIPESALAMLIEDWENALPQGLHLAYLPKNRTIRLRLSSYGEVPPEQVDRSFAQLQQLVQPYLVCTEDKPIELILGHFLQQQQLTIACAESCTGGKIAALLTKWSGSSAWMKGGVVAYDNQVKHHVLGVKQEDLDTYGAVSEQVVRQMAQGVRELCGADVAIATSGIAGPTGGTAQKPVGTVWIAWATPTQTYAECIQAGRDREQITELTCTYSLIKMLKYLQGSK